MKNYLFFILITLMISSCSFKTNTGYTSSNKKCVTKITNILIKKDRASIEKTIGKPYSENFNNNQSTAVYSIKNKNLKSCNNVKQIIIIYDNTEKLIDYQINFD